MSWSHEFGSDCDTSEDANWISLVSELGTVNLNLSSSCNWSSQWSNFRKSWWVEEDELKTFGCILVIESKLEQDADEWWVQVVWWTQAPQLSRGYHLGWFLSESTKDAESIVGVIDIVDIIERQEVVTSEGDRGTTSKRSKIWNQFLYIWIIVVPVFNVLLRVLLSVQ